MIRNNLFLEKVCRVNLNFPESVCDDIQGHDDKQVRSVNFLCKVYVNVEPENNNVTLII